MVWRPGVLQVQLAWRANNGSVVTLATEEQLLATSGYDRLYIESAVLLFDKSKAYGGAAACDANMLLRHWNPRAVVTEALGCTHFAAAVCDWQIWGGDSCSTAVEL